MKSVTTPRFRGFRPYVNISKIYVLKRADRQVRLALIELIPLENFMRRSTSSACRIADCAVLLAGRGCVDYPAPFERSRSLVDTRNTLKRRVRTASGYEPPASNLLVCVVQSNQLGAFQGAVKTTGNQ